MVSRCYKISCVQIGDNRLYSQLSVAVFPKLKCVIKFPELFTIQVTIPKTMAAVYLPQYLANLTQLIGREKVVHLGEIHSCTTNIVCDRFGYFRSFLCVFMNIFRVACAKNIG